MDKLFIWCEHTDRGIAVALGQAQTANKARRVILEQYPTANNGGLLEGKPEIKSATNYEFDAPKAVYNGG